MLQNAKITLVDHCPPSIYFRLEQQAAASRREFDLYDPESKKKDKPARVSDDDPRCQVSGLQLFQG